MTANVFEIKKFSAEFYFEKRNEIKAGCCFDDGSPETIARFSTKEEAIEELKKYIYKPSCSYSSYGVPFYLVQEYAVECYEEDEDGDFVEGCDYDMVYDFEFDAEQNDISIKKDSRFN